MSQVEEPELSRMVLESLQTGVYVFDRQGKVLLWNQGAGRITGYLQHEVLGRDCHSSILAQCNQEGCVTCRGQCPFGSTLHDGRPRECRIQLRHKQGHTVSVRMRIAPVRNRNGFIVAVAQSFDEQRVPYGRNRNQYNLAAYGCLDEVTDVPNSSYLQFQLREDLAAFAEYHVPFGVILIRVDHLPQFRTQYGHHAGDAVLRVVAQTVKDGLRPTDFLGRWSEEQFLAILPNGTTGLQKAGDRIKKLATYAKLQWWGDQLSVTTSIGYASVQPGDTLDSLLQRAQRSLPQELETGDIFRQSEHCKS